MTKIYKIFLFAFTILFLSNTTLQAQQEAEVKKILDKVSRTYKNMKAYKAEFTSKLKKRIVVGALLT